MTADDADLAALRESVRKLLATSYAPDVRRRLLDDPIGYDGAIWRVMADQLGLPGLTIPEKYGGSGASVAAGQIVAVLSPETALADLGSALAQLDAREAERRACVSLRDEARTRLDASRAANARVPGLIPSDELRSRQQAWERFKTEEGIARQAAQRTAEAVRKAQLRVDRHYLRSPRSGVVTKVHKKRWDPVKESDPVLQIRGERESRGR